MGLAVLPKDKIASCSTRRRNRSAGWVPRCNGWSTRPRRSSVTSRRNITDVNDIIQNSAPIIDSQVNSGDAIERWAHNLNSWPRRPPNRTRMCKAFCGKAAPTADQVNSVFSDVRESLPQTLANLEIVFDMLKRYNKGFEQVLVFLPQGASICADGGRAVPRLRGTRLGAVDQPAAALPDRLSSGRGVAVPGGHQRSRRCRAERTARSRMDTPANSVRGARNIPCVDVPGKRAATPRECRDPKTVRAAGHQPVVRRPEPDPELPGPRARCDQSVRPGLWSYPRRRSTTA